MIVFSSSETTRRYLYKIRFVHLYILQNCTESTVVCIIIWYIMIWGTFILNNIFITCKL